MSEFEIKNFANGQAFEVECPMETPTVTGEILDRLSAEMIRRLAAEPDAHWLMHVYISTEKPTGRRFAGLRADRFKD